MWPMEQIGKTGMVDSLLYITSQSKNSFGRAPEKKHIHYKFLWKTFSNMFINRSNRNELGNLKNDRITNNKI